MIDEAGVARLVAQSVELKQRFFAAQARAVIAAGQAMADALRGGGRVLAFGNGGSAADAQHLAAELVGRFVAERAGLAAIALGSDPSTVTSISNDYGYEHVFRRQVEAHGRPGDVAIGLTTSGRSKNVLAALALARERGLRTIALTGAGGSALEAQVDHLFAVPETDTARVQEVHGMIVHLLCQVVDEALVGA